MDIRYAALPLAALVACAGSAQPTPSPSRSRTAPPEHADLQLRPVTRFLPRADRAAAAPTANPPAGEAARLAQDDTCLDTGPAVLVVERVESATVSLSQPGSGPVVDVRVGTDVAGRLAEITRTHRGDPVALVLDGGVIAAPTLQAEITDGEFVIAGDFTQEEAEAIAARLRAMG